MCNGTDLFGNSMTSGNGKIGIVAGNLVAAEGVPAGGDCDAGGPAADSARASAELAPDITRVPMHHTSDTRIATLK